MVHWGSRALKYESKTGRVYIDYNTALYLRGLAIYWLKEVLSIVRKYKEEFEKFFQIFIRFRSNKTMK